MAKAPKNSSIKKEDIPESPEWLEKLILPLNSHMLDVYNCLANGITLADNQSAMIKTIEFKTPAKIQLVGTAGKPAFTNSWTNLNASADVQCGYFKENGMVYVQGMVANGVIGLPIFTLPAAYWPSAIFHFPVTGLLAYAEAAITAAGEVYPSVGSNAAFSLNFSFPAADPCVTTSTPFPLQVKSTLKGKCVGMYAIFVNNVDSPGKSPPGAVTVDFEDPGRGIIFIRNIYGLKELTNYQVTLVGVTG